MHGLRMLSVVDLGSLCEEVPRAKGLLLIRKVDNMHGI